MHSWGQRKKLILQGCGVVLLSSFLLCMAYNYKANASELPGVTSKNIGYSTVLYNSENGLPTSEANAIVQTSDGFIWIGGYSGLIRYDGNKFQRFDSTTGITSVACLFIDSEGKLWIGTNDKGIALYKNGKFKIFGKDQGLTSGSIKKIAEDVKGNLYMGTTSGVAYIDKDMKIHMVNDSRISSKYISDLSADAKGNIVGCTLDGDIFVVKGRKVNSFYQSGTYDFPKVKSVNIDKAGKVYFGTEENCIVETEVSKGVENSKIIKVASLASINQVFPMDNGVLWICADNGVGYLDTKQHFVPVSGVPLNNSIDDMMKDYEGNLWFTSSRQGVMKLVTNRFKNISLDAGLPDTVVNTTCMYQENLYVGTDTGLYVLNGFRKQIKNKLTKLLKGIRIRCIIEDLKGSLWVCTYGDCGLVKYDKFGNITSFNSKNGLNSNRVRTIIEGSSGDMIVSSSGGVNIIRKDKIVASYSAKEGIVNTEILSVCEGQDGTIYAGSDGGGIYVIDHDRVSCLNEKNGLESDVILQIKKDPKSDGYWIITGNSIAYMIDGKIKTIKGFPYSNNFDMFFSNTNDAWILSSNGIYVINDTQLQSDNILKYQFYNIDYGMPSNVTANSRSYIDKKGKLYVAGSANVFSININQNEKSVQKVKLAVPYVEIDNRKVYIKNGQKLVIPTTCKRLTIYGYALSYTLQNPEVDYCLEGFDDNYTVTKKSEFNPISYTNLKGGKYVFHMIVRSEDGNANNALLFRFEKTKTFWETAWFILALTGIIILFLVLFALIFVRIHNLKLINKQKKAKILIKQIISAFAKTIDGKDKYTNGHSFRVAEYASLLAKELGYDPEQVEEVRNIAMLHDIGKISIPDAILNKTEQLTDEEFALMKQHTSSGYEILSEISIFPELSLGARYHHEKIDGSGYPLGLKGEEIPSVAKIVAVADTFDAMYSTRSYREKLSIDYVADELKRVAGLQLDEEIVDVMIRLIKSGKIQEDVASAS